MVEQSIISAPFAACGMTSLHTETTCLPAGSMVMTTSASLTEAAALAAIATPSDLAWSSKPCTRSKPETLCPALTRLAAIGPPMLPSAMNAMCAMVLPPVEELLFRLIEHELVLAEARKIRRQHFRRDVLDFTRRPFRIAVLVDHRRAYALAKIIAGEHFERRAIFPHEALLQRRRLPRQPQQFQRHHHAARRFFVQGP